MYHFRPNKLSTYWTLSLFLLFFTSCQKEITTDIGNAAGTPAAGLDRVKTYTEDITAGTFHRSETFELSYDASGRILSINSTTTPGDKFTFNYNPDNTYIMELFNSNVLSIHEKFYINNLPFVDSS